MKKIEVVSTTKTQRAIFIIVLSIMIIGFIYSFVNIFIAPIDYEEGVTLIKNDYILRASQTIGGIVLLFLPSFLEKKWNFKIPSMMHSFVFLFLFAAIMLGEYARFHFRVPGFDKVLHILSSAFFASLSFTVIHVLNYHEIFKLRPLFVAIFAFTFSMTIAVFWEFYEFSWDYFANLNMLKYMDSAGNEFSGLSAIYDTMGDLFVATIGAGVISIIGYFAIKYEKTWIYKFIIRRKKVKSLSDDTLENTDKNNI